MDMSSPESPASPAESHDEDPPQQDDDQAKSTASKVSIAIAVTPWPPVCLVAVEDYAIR